MHRKPGYGRRRQRIAKRAERTGLGDDRLSTDPQLVALVLLGASVTYSACLLRATGQAPLRQAAA
jgi:hypothetical protein